MLHVCIPLDGFLVSLPAAFKDTDIRAMHLLLSSRFFEIAILISVVGLEVIISVILRPDPGLTVNVVKSGYEYTDGTIYHFLVSGPQY